MDPIEGRPIPAPFAAMLGDPLAAAFDADRIDPGAERDPLVGIPDGDRVIVRIEPHQRQRADASGDDPRRIERVGRQGEEGRELASESLGVGVGLAPGAAAQVLATSLREDIIERREIVGDRDGDEEVPPRVADEVLDVTLLVGTSDQAEVGIEEVMALQSFKRFREDVAAAVGDLGDGGAGVVVADPARDAAEEGEGAGMPFEEGLGSIRAGRGSRTGRRRRART